MARWIRKRYIADKHPYIHSQGMHQRTIKGKNMKALRSLLLRILILFTCPTFLYALDLYHYYRAPFFFQETRLGYPWLTSVDFFAGGGGTRNSFDRNHNEVPLLSLYGPENLQFIGQGVTLQDPSNPFDQVLAALPALGSHDHFGRVCFDGHFHIFEAAFSVIQNFTHGFFVQAYLPIRQLELSEICFKDQSPLTGIPNLNNPLWQELISNLSAITKRYGLSIDAGTRSGVGDLSLLLGWTHTLTSTWDIDFFDVTLRAGILMPTSKHCINHAFLPQISYNHWGLPAMIQFALGLFDWLNFGMQGFVLWLFDRNQMMRIKTSENQNGMIKLATACVKVDPGVIWQIGAYIKADHVIHHMISLLVGYSFVEQRSTRICLPDNSIPHNIINNDQTLRSWEQHTIHALVEFDFVNMHHIAHPRLTIFYNVPVAGQRIFATPLFGGSIGAEITWNY